MKNKNNFNTKIFEKIATSYFGYISIAVRTTNEESYIKLQSN